jgi:carboxyl-terminal processing protease
VRVLAKTLFVFSLLVISTCNALAADESAVGGVTAQPRWIQFVKVLEEDHLRAVDEKSLKSRCEEAVRTVQDTKDKDPFDLCVIAALRAFDPDADYISHTQLAKERRESANQHVGVGLELAQKATGSGLLVVSPIVDSPGDRGGVKAGDLIVGIDGVDVRPLTLEDSVELLRGKTGSIASLQIVRAPNVSSVTLNIAREQIRARTVRRKVLANNVAYIRLSYFNEITPRDFLDGVRSVATSSPTGLVVDLRASPGGLLRSVVAVGAMFSLTDSVVVVVNRRDAPMTMTSSLVEPPKPALTDDQRQWLVGVPIVVLVNETTGSGSEALAQYLREKRGARLLGTRTAGVALIHTRRSLGADAAVKFVSGEMVSPNGLLWKSTGLAPDINVNGDTIHEWGDPRDAVLHQAADLLVKQ